ncbi:MAG: 50S ribosomal protein L25 [Thermomicrobiales bacterium]
MAELMLRAEPRTVVGKKVKQLRRDGKIPGVVYGPLIDGTVQVSVDRKELEKFYWTNGQSALFTLEWEGGSQQVFIHEVQIDPVKRNPLHVDFFAPNMLKDLSAMVPVVLHHFSSEAEGILTHPRSEVEVRAMPSVLPHQIDVDVSHLLHVGDVLRAADLTMPADVILVTDPDEAIALLVAESLPEVEEVEEAAEAAEAAEAVTEDGETAAEASEGRSGERDES